MKTPIKSLTSILHYPFSKEKNKRGKVAYWFNDFSLLYATNVPCLMFVEGNVNEVTKSDGGFSLKPLNDMEVSLKSPNRFKASDNVAESIEGFR
ncbi:hypothetical protein M8C21_004964 [Ambrosia artemisiifolia]|uniref:Uncharacterized protein n=1 Tax=Ambrosia artemisiifolia TaxID=4212 RepID=A0AAD5G7X8_AMBAR|nr:hypothetical protein M8C21_004964 [Ambrosia artemisiifolia]